MADGKRGRAPGESLVGRTSKHWTVIAQAEKPETSTIRGTWWLCRCVCGTEKAFPRCSIIQQSISSCGCVEAERRRQAAIAKAEKLKQAKEGKRKRNIPAGLALNFEELAKTTVCYECKKTFAKLSQEWAYKVRVGERFKPCCSWKCVRSHERKKEQKRSGR